MSATSSGALKAVMESAGLGVKVARDGAPADWAPPYVIVYEGIDGDYDNIHLDRVIETCQVDVWQPRDGEQADLPLRLALAIKRGPFPKIVTGAVYAARPTAPRRIPPSPEDTLVRHTFDVVLTRTVGV